MLIAISPAKSLDFDTPPLPDGLTPTEPRLMAEAERLATRARNVTLRDLKALMHLSDDLARLNRDRFRDWADAPAAPAALAFAGDTYRGLDARSLDGADLRAAQDRLRILSGLYGVLRPLDAIRPHRLEMGTRLRTRRGANLYEFWGDRVARTLRADADALGTDVLIDCASSEYFRAADRPALGLRVIRPTFLERDAQGRTQMVSFHAKRARGAMARWVVTTDARAPADLRGFDLGGYGYEDGPEDAPVFVRDTPSGD
ncbi:MAG: peroxide stress protein YaaA [Paracoccaceae bacterium]